MLLNIKKRNAATRQIKKAQSQEYGSSIEFLRNKQLPAEDIDTNKIRFFISFTENEIAGTIGLEIYESIALLRSMATDPVYRNRGVAPSLLEALIEYAKKKEVKELYLLTETAEAFFHKRGFLKINREEAPQEIKQSTEVSHICSFSVVLMKKEI